MPKDLQTQRKRKPRVTKRPSLPAMENHFGTDVHEYSAADLGRLFNLSAALLRS